MEFFRGNQKSAGRRVSNGNKASLPKVVLAKEPSVHGIPQWEHPKGGCDDPFTQVFECVNNSGKTVKKPHSASSSRQRHPPHKAGKTQSRQLKDSPARSPSKSPAKPSLKTLMDSRGREFRTDIVLPSFASEELDARPKIDEIVSNLQGDHHSTSLTKKPNGCASTEQSNAKPTPKKGTTFRPPAPLCAESEDNGSGEDKSDSLSAEHLPLHVEESTRIDSTPQCPGALNRVPSLKLSSLNDPASSRSEAPKRVPSLKQNSLEASNSSLVGTKYVATDSSAQMSSMSLEMSLDDCFADDPHYETLLEEQENEMIRLAMENSMQDLALNSSANFDQVSCRSGDSSCASRGGGGGRKHAAAKRLSKIDEPHTGDFDDDYGIEIDIWDDPASSNAPGASKPDVGSPPASGYYSVRERALAEMHQGGPGPPLGDSFS